MTTILALDTASELCSVSLIGEGVCSSQSEEAPRSHVQRLLPMARQLLSEQGKSLKDLDAIAFGRGPGSFTGLRIAAGFTQGLAYGQDIPVVSVSNLQALALQAFNSDSHIELCLTLIDARMDEVYWAVYSKGADGLPILQGEERVDKPEEVAALLESASPMTVIGSGLLYVKRMGRIQEWPSVTIEAQHPAELIANLAMPAFEEGKALSAEKAAPVYVRDEVAWKKLPGRE